ncbi:FAD-dependent oxidoreductase, partial [Klebsiella pneumoniae]|uniref:FAD-dependent oxidoreductase n=1 Tax=Klebsiella pneumoniae TaxID=573 RepID=UPI00351CCB67
MDSEVVDRDFIAKEVPYMDLDCAGHNPVMGALYHAPGAVARHDAVAWGYARGAYNRGVEILQKTRVSAIRTQGDRV